MPAVQRPLVQLAHSSRGATWALVCNMPDHACRRQGGACQAARKEGAGHKDAGEAGDRGSACGWGRCGAGLVQSSWPPSWCTQVGTQPGRTQAAFHTVSGHLQVLHDRECKAATGSPPFGLPHHCKPQDVASSALSQQAAAARLQGETVHSGAPPGASRCNTTKVQQQSCMTSTLQGLLLL